MKPSLSALRRSYVVFLHDVVMAALSFLLSLYLRLGDDVFRHADARDLATWTGAFAVTAGAVFWSQGMYRGVWRYASLKDLYAITRSVSLAILVFLLVMFMWTRLDLVPRSVLIINWFVLLFFLGAPRFGYRLAKDGMIALWTSSGRQIPVLLVGAGDAAELFIRAMQRPDAQYHPVGILAYKPGRVGRDIRGVRVLGRVDELRAVLDRLDRKGLRPHKVIVASTLRGTDRLKQLLEECQALNLPIARLPAPTDFRPENGDRIQVQPIALEDLLGRPQALLDRDGMRRLVEGRRVLVTGAGGSIGSELVRQVAAFGPAELTLLDSSEYALYTIDMEMAESHPDLPREPRLADVRDRVRVESVIAERAPELVFHAAALKHVPMVEANPVEGVLTNAIGTRVVADACRAHGVRTMVLISTDKAVNPTNVMGASKRIAERYCQALDLAARGDAGEFQIVTVRFGNVLGSTGSVVPLFRRQLERGGPLTVTHPEMTRYFMTIHEAVELVLQASAYGTAVEDYRGRIFVLDMGDPVKIVDLARNIIRLSGLRPGDDVKIEFTGLRPGEKLFEEIFHGEEPPLPTARPGILVAATRAGDLAEMAAAFDRLEQAARRGDAEAVRGMVRDLVPEYAPMAGAAE